MSSIPVIRRTTTRTTRTMKDTENATARPIRPTTRAKLAAATASSHAASRLTAPTVASKAKTVVTDVEGNVGKRKREALAEVATGANKNKPASSASAKGKEAGPTKPAASGGAQRVLRRAPPAVTRTAKAVQQAVAPAKVKEEDTKPPSRSRIPQVYRDDAPDEREVDEKKRPVEDEERVVKRRHMEAVKEDPQEHQMDAPEDVKPDLKLEEAKAEEEAPVAFQVEEPVELWDDLDADDWDDPLMVSEYVQDVCKYWKQTELETLPSADYMEMQDEVTWDHRATLVDWLIQVHARFNLLPESLFLTVNLLDRFLGKRKTSLVRLQLVGLAAFFVASKFEETCAPSVKEIVILADNMYTESEVLKAEQYLLKVLGWDLRNPGPMSWLRRGSKADDCETTARTVAKYLIEISCLERRLVGIVASHIAAAGLWLARLVVGREEWTPNLAHYTTFTEQEILPIAAIMLEYITTTPIPHDALFKKYAHKRYMKCSIYLRQWATDRWRENSDINLARDIGRIKEEVRRHNAQIEEDTAAQAVAPR